MIERGRHQHTPMRSQWASREKTRFAQQHEGEFRFAFGVREIRRRSPQATGRPERDGCRPPEKQPVGVIHFDPGWWRNNSAQAHPVANLGFATHCSACSQGLGGGFGSQPAWGCSSRILPLVP